MAESREARMQQRMRGAQRHQVQEASFDLFIDLPDAPDDTAAPPSDSPQPASAVRTTPNTSAKRRRLNDGSSSVPGPDDVKDTTGSVPRPTPRSAVSLIGRRAVGPSREEEISESPADAPGSGQRRSVIATAAAASRSAALQQIMSNAALGGGAAAGPAGPAGRQRQQPPRQIPSSSSPPQRLPSRRVVHARTASANTDPSEIDIIERDELSPELTTAIEGSLGGSGAGAPANGIDNAVDELSSPSFAAGMEPVTSSSPLARKSRGAAQPTRATRASRAAPTSTNTPAAAPLEKENVPADDHDELSPDQPLTAVRIAKATTAGKQPSRTQRSSEVPSSSPLNRPTKRIPLQPSQSSPSQRSRRRAIPPVPEAQEQEEEEQAEETSAREAARTIGRKRPRRSTVHEQSPELGSDPTQAETAAAEKEGPVTASRRQRRQRLVERSPSAQNQPRPPKARGKAVSATKRASSGARPTKKPKASKRKRRRGDDGSGNENESQDDLVDTGKGAGRGSRGAPVPITVQRFTRIRTTGRGRGNEDDGNEDDDENDELTAFGADIAFANRSGVNAVDVLAQVCEDIVEQKLQGLQEKYQQARRASTDGGTSTTTAAAAAAIRKDILVARRALEAFQQEVRTRLLEQAVAVDSLHALRKRVRAAHKAKLALREEILRIRAERDQVGLRMDALRDQHQERVRAAMKTANLSAAMHDIDLAVEQGRVAPELATTAQQKAADLANLELVVRRVAEQVSSLQKIKEFNAFLERTAAVLEGRRLPAKAAAA